MRNPAAARVPRWHEVRKGETLWSISRRYGIPVSRLMILNNLPTPSAVKAGMRLRLRGGWFESEPPRPLSRTVTVRLPFSIRRKGESLFEWPVAGRVILGFGWHAGAPHTGIDVAAPLGTPVRAAADGRVIYSDRMRGYGNVVILDHGNGFFTVYGNNARNVVGKGERIRRGAVVARVGAEVESAVPHLHFEIRKGNKAVDPLRYLPSRTR